MAYLTGVANTLRVFLDAIQSAATSNGWTLVHRGEDTGGGSPASEDYRRDVLWLESGGHYAGITAKDPPDGGGDFFLIIGATGFDSGLKYSEQPGYFGIHQYYSYIPCKAYHLFVTSQYLYGVVEGEAKHFRHFGFGHMEKQDNYVGGGFICSHSIYGSGANYAPFRFESYYSPSAAVLVGGDGYAPRWRKNNRWDSFPNGMAGAIFSSRGALTDQLIHSGSNQFNNQMILQPLLCSIMRQGGYQSPIGYPPGMRACNISQHGDSIIDVPLGPDNWKVFPAGRRNSTIGATESSIYGLAYLVV